MTTPSADARARGVTEKGLPTAIVLGLDVSTASAPDFVDLIGRWAMSGTQRIAVGVNAHVCNASRRDARFRQKLMAADMLYADGQSVAWAIRLLGGPRVERIATTDVALPLIDRMTAHGAPVFFLGGRPGIAAAAAARVRTSVPTAAIGTRDGYFADEENEAVIKQIRTYGTRVLFVGFGDPRQLDWISANRDVLGPIVILTCGGLFDWLSESRPRAPRWMIKAGLEWLWRLVLEPRRLGSRYVLGNPRFAISVLSAMARGTVRSSKP